MTSFFYRKNTILQPYLFNLKNTIHFLKNLSKLSFLVKKKVI